MNRINIAAGECLAKIIKKRYIGEYVIPFNEAMITGTYTEKLFSDRFLAERAKTHNVTVPKYRENLSEFLKFLWQIDDYGEVVLWFGEEPFCAANTEVVLKTLEEYNFGGKITLNITDEETGDIVKTKIIRA